MREVGLKNTTKQDLIQEASLSSGRPQTETRVVAEQFMRVITELLFEEKTIELRGFGTFYTKARKPRPARNPRTGEICPLGHRRVALFRFSPDVRDRVHEVPELQEALASEAATYLASVEGAEALA
jgi:nucleoid DNA-binding protein